MVIMYFRYTHSTYMVYIQVISYHFYILKFSTFRLIILLILITKRYPHREQLRDFNHRGTPRFEAQSFAGFIERR